MRKKKLSLEGLKVNSFITNLDTNNSKTLKGGQETQQLPVCDPNQTQNPPCEDEIPSRIQPCSGGCGTALNTCTREVGTINCNPGGNGTVGCTVVC